MITIKLTDEQYDLVEMAIGIAETYFDEQLDVLEDIAPSWKNSMVKELEDLYLNVKELHDDFETGKLEKSKFEEEK